MNDRSPCLQVVCSLFILDKKHENLLFNDDIIKKKK